MTVERVHDFGPDTPRSVQRLLRALEVAGCSPRPAGPGIWFAACPTCLQHGWPRLVEIRQTDAGIVVACTAAHQPPAKSLRRAA